MKNHFQESLEQGLKALHLSASSSIQDALMMYVDLLEKWSQVINLTSIRKPQEMITKHILDSVAVSPYLQGKRIVDVGTGAGLPGIPLALLHPESEFTLVESREKKIHFLIQVKQMLPLPNVKLVHERVENFKPEQCFDVVISRAFASIKDMLHATQHLCCPQGKFFAMKGVYPSAEILDIPSEFTVSEVIALQVPGLNAERNLIVLKRKTD